MAPRDGQTGSGSPQGREKPARILGCALLGPKAAKCRRVTVGAGYGRLPGIVCAHVPGHGTCSHPRRPRRWLSLPNVPAWASCLSSVHRAASGGAMLLSPRRAQSSGWTVSEASVETHPVSGPREGHLRTPLTPCKGMWDWPASCGWSICFSEKSVERNIPKCLSMIVPKTCENWKNAFFLFLLCLTMDI